MPAPRTTLPRRPDPLPYPRLGRRLRAARRATAGLSIALLAAALGGARRVSTPPGRRRRSP
jgi:hypothetical protein